MSSIIRNVIERIYQELPSFVVKRTRRLTSDEFNDLISIVRRLGGERIGDYTWNVSTASFLKFENLDDIAQAIQRLVSLGALEPSVAEKLDDFVKKFFSPFFAEDAVYVQLGRGEGRGEDFVFVLGRASVLDKLAKELEKDQFSDGFVIRKRVFNPQLRRYEEKTYRRYYRDSWWLAFRRGLLPRFLRLAERAGVKIVNRDSIKYTQTDESKITIPLRDYQLRAVRNALKQIELSGAATIMAATGAGKTEMGLAIAQALTPSNDNPVIVVVPTRDLVDQWYKRAESYGIRTGYAFGDNIVNPDAPILITTYASAYRASTRIVRQDMLRQNMLSSEELELKQFEEEEEIESEEIPSENVVDLLTEKLKNATAVIVDEAHHVPARTVTRISMATPSAVKVGLSATPWRNDLLDLKIYEHVGEIADRVTSSELIERGFLLPAKIFMLKTGVSGSYLSYQSEKKAVLSDPGRIQLTVDLVKILPKPIMILTQEKSPGELITKALRDANINAELIHGSLSEEERARILDEFKNGKIDVLVATTLADEGLDIPSLRSLILYFPGKSKTRVFQRIGRALRIDPSNPDKKFAVIVDLVDNTPYFSEHATERLEMYKQESKWEVYDVSSVEDIRKILEKEGEKISETESSKIEERIERYIKKGWIQLKPEELKTIVMRLRDITPDIRQPVLAKKWTWGPYEVYGIMSLPTKEMAIVYKYVNATNKNESESKSKRKKAVAT